MPREKEGYRDQLEDILTYFNQKRLLSVTDVAKYLGISTKRARQKFGFTGETGITAVDLARKLCI
jgi:predicted ArsR family transcriptional regulator